MKRRIVLFICSVLLLVSFSSSQINESFTPAKNISSKTNPRQRLPEMGESRHNRMQDMRIATPNNRQLSFREESTIQAIIADFQVNENAGPSGANQYYPAIAADGAGNFIITWVDCRNGDDSDIYAQRYNREGVAIVGNFRVNDDSSNIDEYSYPAIAVDGAGNFIITWKDYRNGDDGDIYAQRYNNQGAAIGSNFRVNDDSGSSRQYSPAIAADDAGNFIITWVDCRNGDDGDDGDIYTQCYTSEGAAIDGNFRVNDDSGSAWLSDPAIAADGAGNFIITWEDKRNGDDRDIYAQRYTSQGAAIGGNFLVNDDSGSSRQYSPAIVADSAGNFIITWVDDRNGDYFYDIYAQRYTSQGAAIGGNFRVNDDNGSAPQWYPAIAADDAGNFIITWVDYRNGDDGDIYTQCYTSEGAAIGSNSRVNDDSGSAWLSVPAIAANGTGNFIITWNDYRNGDYNIYAQLYNSEGGTQGGNFRVNDDSGSSGQYYPAIAADGAGNFIITWRDERYGGGDIYAQRYTSQGAAIDGNFRVNNVSGSACWDAHPAIAVDGAGNFIITWYDDRNDYDDIYAQRYNNQGTAISGNFRVNDDSSRNWLSHPAIAADSAGNFIITWGDDRNGNDDFYAQRYTSQGAAIGGNFWVNDDSSSRSTRSHPAIAADGSDIFIITWQDSRNICAQRYTSQGAAIGGIFLVNDDSGSAWQLEPAIAADGAGNFIIIWVECKDDYVIFAQRYNSQGAAIGGNFRVTDDIGSANQPVPAIAADDAGNFIIIWQDERNGDSDIYAQRYDNNGVALGANFRATGTSKKEQSSPAVTLVNNKIYNTWQSNIAGGTGYDIWANVLDWNDPTSSVNELYVRKNDNYRLRQNYPNPFNPVTTIEYQLPRDSEVSVCIYNITGELIRTIVSQKQAAGHYRIQWDGRDNYGNAVAGGVYLYQLKTEDFTQTNKMVLIR